jgi:hypothetical protein
MTAEAPASNLNPDFKTTWWTPRLTGPVIAAAAVRLGLLAVALVRFGIDDLFQSDTTGYLIPGRNLLLHGQFMADGVPDLVRTPGYPLFLAITSLAGFPAAAVANVLLSVVSVILVWKLGRVAFGDERIALIAAWIFAFEPVSISQAGFLLSDTLFVMLLLLALERLAVFLRARHLRVLAMAGIWLAAAALVRPIGYYLPVALALGLFLVLARVPGLRWKAPAVLLISAMPWLAAWQIRNWAETGYGGFSSVREINLYFQVAAGTKSSLENRSFLEVRKELGYSDFDKNSGQIYLLPAYLVSHPEQARWNQEQRLAFMRSDAARIIRAHYGAYLRMGLISLYKTALIPGEQYFDRLLYPGDPAPTPSLMHSEQRRMAIMPSKGNIRQTAEKAVFAVLLLSVYFLAVRGAFRGGMHNLCLWLLLGTLLYFFAVSGAGGEPGGNLRFRLPIMPIVCILAAAGLPRPRTIAR